MAASIITATQGAPGAAQLAQPAAAKAWKAAQDFEAMALSQFLAPIFQAVDSAGGAFGGGEGETAWRPMLTQEIARHIAAHGGLGLAAPVFHQILQLQQATTEQNA
jgi:peptidoglycan hydrolase FlgJ